MFKAVEEKDIPINIFLISPREHMLWVFIRSASESCVVGASNEYP